MEGSPQPIPLEEQLKQDPRFSYLLQVSPELTPTVAGLISKKPDQHSAFWLAYLQCTNTYLNGMDANFGKNLSNEKKEEVTRLRSEDADDTSKLIRGSEDSHIFSGEEFKGIQQGMGSVQNNFVDLLADLPFFFGIKQRVVDSLI